MNEHSPNWLFCLSAAFRTKRFVLLLCTSALCVCVCVYVSISMSVLTCSIGVTVAALSLDCVNFVWTKLFYPKQTITIYHTNRKTNLVGLNIYIGSRSC